MKVHIRFVSAFMVILLVFGNSVFPPAVSGDFEEFNDDITGHWAEKALRQAYQDGIIVGVRNSLLPDATTTTAQVLAIICRALGATVSADISGWGLDENAWYYSCTSQAAYLGLVSSVDARGLSAPISRQDAFYLLAEAFQLIKATPDLSVLDQFADSGLITNTRRQAIASLVSEGLIAGYNGKLHVDKAATRADVVALLYRIAGEYLPAPPVSGNYDHGVILQGAAGLSGARFSKGVWFDCASSDIYLDGIRADRIAIRSHTLNSLDISGDTRIGSLALAAQSGDITVSPGEGAAVNAFVVGTGRGKVTVSGINIIEVTGNDRRVIVSADAEKVTVTGRNNIIQVQDGSRVNRIELLRSATDSRVVIDGDVRELEIIGLGAVVSGGGYADTLILSPNHTRVDVKYGNMREIIDQGIIEASVSLDIPASLPVGNTLVASATIKNALPGKKCDFTWYINNAPVLDGVFETGDVVPKLSHNFDYSRNMKSSADVRISIKYTTEQSESQEISAESTVSLENYNKQHWMKLDAPRVLDQVTTGYSGDFTLEWALENDFDDYDKEVWIYAKGYTSTTDYLLWISIAYQRVNVFQKIGGNWELIRTCIVGTGAPRSPTGTGVTTVTYRQYYGWTTRDYTVKPVVRFRRGSGYAFHSRIFYPNTSTIRDDSIGFPVSRGCIRMYDEDIWYLYDYIPDGTTVVIY